MDFGDFCGILQKNGIFWMGAAELRAPNHIAHNCSVSRQQRSAYPSLRQFEHVREVEGHYFPNTDDVSWARGVSRHAGEVLSHLLLLKATDALGFVPDLEALPTTYVDRVRRHLHGVGLSSQEISNLRPSKTTLYRRFHASVRQKLGLKAFDERARLQLVQYLEIATQTQHSTIDLINLAVEWLLRAGYELPAESALERLASPINESSHNITDQIIAGRMSDNLREKLSSLIEAVPSGTASEWSRVHRLAPAPKPTEIREHLVWVDWIWTFGELAPLFKDIPVARVRFLAAEVSDLAPSQVVEFRTAHRFSAMAAAIHEMQQRGRDDLVNYFVKRIREIEHKAREEFADQQRALDSIVAGAIRVLLNILLALKERKALKLVRLIWDIIWGAGTREALIVDCRAILEPHRFAHLPLIAKHMKSTRLLMFDLISRLPLKATTAHPDLLPAVEMATTYAATDVTHLPRRMTLEWTTRKWSAMIQAKVHGNRVYRHMQFEVAALLELAEALRSGDVAVRGAAEHADYRDNLVSWTDTKEGLSEYSSLTGIVTTNGQTFAEDLAGKLELCIDRAKLRLNTRPLKRRRDGDPVLQDYAARPPSAKSIDLERLVLSKLTDRGMLEILVNANARADFLRRFGPMSGRAPKIQASDELQFLTLFAYASGLGPTQVCKHLPGKHESDRIYLCNRHNFSVAKLAQANADVINAVQRLPLSAVYGKGLRAGADGTYVPIFENNLFASKHFRYLKFGGVKHVLVSDKYVALFSTFIMSSEWEATYLIDLYYGNRSKIRPVTVHGDTQSQSAPILGLGYLLGIDIRPRIRRWKKVALYWPRARNKPDFLEQMWRAPVNWALIADQFEDVMRVVASIQKGRLVPSNLVKHLGTYSASNKLYRALREIGNVIRTMVVLDYISDEDEQRAVTEVTNKVEAYHRFEKWFVIGEHGMIRSNDPDEFNKRTLQRDLMANSAILQTTIDLTHVFRELDQLGYSLTREDVRHITPLITSHIKRFGEFAISLNPTSTISAEDLMLPSSLAEPLAPPSFTVV